MKASRFVAYGLASVTVALLVAACTVPLTSLSKGGSLSIQVNNHINSRTLLPPIDMTAASYTVSGTGPGGATFSQSATGGSVTVSSLAFGTWGVTVNALNAAGTIIGSGQATVTVSTGQTATVDITVVPLSGNGTLNVTVTWTASQVGSPSIQASLTPPTGTATPLSFSISGNQATYSSTTIPAGYQTLTLQLLDGNNPVMGAVDVARIVAGQTTTGTYNFTNLSLAGGSVQVNITPALADPIPVSISGVAAAIAAGTNITATASVRDGTSNVVYVWYLNGASQSTGAADNLGSGLAVGYYRLDVTAFTADGTRAGSASASFQVTGTTAGTGTHVYIAGSVGTSSSSTVPVYWKDGVLNYLPLTSGNLGGGAWGIAEDRFGNMYIAGGQGNATSFQLGYWKNATFVPLSLGSYTAGFTSSIAVDTNGNVWTQGYLGTTNTDTFVYWENSQGPYVLPSSPNVSPGTPNTAWTVFADASGNAYFIGSVGAILPQGAPCCSSAELPYFWKNGGVPTPLTMSGGNNFAYAHGIAEDSAGNLYMTGNQWSLTGGSIPGPVYWKTVGGVWQGAARLPLGSYPGDSFWAITSLAFDSSGNAYIVGENGSSDTGPWTLVYWKGLTSSPTPMPLPAGFTYVYVGDESTAVDPSGNFYVAGQVGNTEQGVFSTPFADGVPVYWQNGNPIMLPMGSGNTYGRPGIIVVGP